MSSAPARMAAKPPKRMGSLRNIPRTKRHAQHFAITTPLLLTLDPHGVSDDVTSLSAVIAVVNLYVPVVPGGHLVGATKVHPLAPVRPLIHGFFNPAVCGPDPEGSTGVVAGTSRPPGVDLVGASGRYIN